MLSISNYESRGYKVGNRYFGIETTDGGYEYTVYSMNFWPEKTGVVKTKQPIETIARQLMEDLHFDLSQEIVPVHNDFLAEGAQIAGAIAMGLI